MREDDLIATIEIGSSKIIVVISEVNESGDISILGIGQASTESSVRNGVVINIEKIVQAIYKAVESAEIQAGREIDELYLGISGSNIESLNSRGVVAIAGSDKEIKESDIERVIEAAKAVAIPMDRDILHIIPQGFIVDGQDYVKYPIGMIGTRLECQIHIITTAISSIQNIVKCFERAGMKIKDMTLQNIATSKVVLTNDEKELGILMIDIGEETAKVSIYYRQAPQFNAVYPLGGHLITNDLAAVLMISLENAEKLKVDWGSADTNYVESSELVHIPSVGGRPPKKMQREELVTIIRPRVEEIFSIIYSDIKKKGYMDFVKGGVVITGGTSLLPGIEDVATEIFRMPARIGYPTRFSGFGDQLYSPEYSTIIGLVLNAHENNNKEDDASKRKSKKNAGNKSNFLGKVVDFIEDFF